MSEVTLSIDGREVRAPRGASILEAARRAGIYVPVLCHHPDLPPAEGLPPAAAVYQGGERIENAMPEVRGSGCGLCLVEVEDLEDLVESCSTEALNGMSVATNNERIRRRRQENLIPILAGHPHACLTCVQREGCSRSQCSANVPEDERCCPRFGHCELQDAAAYVGISEATPKWVSTNLPVIENDPLFVRDYNLCIGCTRCVRSCADLRGVEALGFVRDEQGRVRVGTLGPTLTESGCRFCTACVEVCPTGALADKGVRPGKKDEDLVSCRAACPARVDVPDYVRLIAGGRPDEANAVIREKVPFPGVLGRVCVRPCEDACLRGEVNEPVAVCALKRYAADNDKGFWKRGLRVEADTGRRAAVVGAGPAGLAAAFYLRKAGHRVTLFESEDRPGGMMRYAIPPYRLPREIMDGEIMEILDLGIDFRPGRALGRDFRLEDLKSEGYEALFLGVGARLARELKIEGAELSGVLSGVDFLRRAAYGDPPELQSRVLVIGGGNAAVDAARTVLRCGAEHVSVACLERREDMPANESEVERMLAEGVRLMPSRGPGRILGNAGRVKVVELLRCTAVFDSKGRFGPIFDRGARETVDADQVIIAIGQAADLSFLEEGSPIKTDSGLIVVDRATQETGAPDVYAGGDAVEAPGSIIQAVAAGRRAAAAMDKALGGSGDLDDPAAPGRPPGRTLGREEGFAGRHRVPVPELDPASASACFDEAALGYDSAAAAREASRCLQCDLRLHIGSNPPPPGNRLPFIRESIEQVPRSEGVYRLMDAEGKVLTIKGTADLRQELLRELEDNEKAAMFDFEEDKMYSKRESELIQRHLQEYGEMPCGIDGDLDDLF